jgi:hypothetical protein
LCHVRLDSSRGPSGPSGDPFEPAEQTSSEPASGRPLTGGRLPDEVIHEMAAALAASAQRDRDGVGGSRQPAVRQTALAAGGIVAGTALLLLAMWALGALM